MYIYIQYMYYIFIYICVCVYVCVCVCIYFPPFCLSQTEEFSLLAAEIILTAAYATCL